jgi:uncharacterized protein DUF3800
LAVFEAFFDESKRPGGIFCVAGFVFVASQSKTFSREWLRFVGPYWPFHMVEFVRRKDKINRKAKFADMTDEEHLAFLRGAIELIKRRMTVAISISCNAGDVKRLSPGFRGFRDAYSVCCYLCMSLLADWIKSRGLDDRVAYVFEQGSRFKGEADFLVGMAGKHPVTREQFRYESHAFVNKESSSQVQAADLYAWELAKFLDDTVTQRKRSPRKSLKALVGKYPMKFEGRHLEERAFRKYFEELRALGLKSKEWYR